MQELRRESPDSDAIVFTGDAEAESGQRAVELGAYRYLAMPYDVRDLIWNLRTLEQHRRVRRERDWLRVLSEIADRTQSVGSVREVAHELVKGGQRLGFERSTRVEGERRQNTAGRRVPGWQPRVGTLHRAKHRRERLPIRSAQLEHE